MNLMPLQDAHLLSIIPNVGVTPLSEITVARLPTNRLFIDPRDRQDDHRIEIDRKK